VSDVDVEAVGVADLAGEGGGCVVVELGDGAAAAADQVGVVGVGGEHVGGRGLLQVGVRDQLVVGQDLQGPIHRRQVQSLQVRLGPFVDLLRRGVPKSGKRIEHQRAGGCHPQAVAS